MFLLITKKELQDLATRVVKSDARNFEHFVKRKLTNLVRRVIYVYHKLLLGNHSTVPHP